MSHFAVPTADLQTQVCQLPALLSPLQTKPIYAAVHLSRSKFSFEKGISRTSKASAAWLVEVFAWK